jgi:hypothetical protein
MKLDFEVEEARELLVFLIERMSKDAGLAAADVAALRKWRTSLRPGSETIREFTAKLNAELARTFETQRRSAIVRADWQ